MSLDTSFVLGLIADLGKTATITPAGRAYSPSSGQGVHVAPIPVTVKITPPEPMEVGFGADPVTSTRVTCYVASSGLGFTPVAGDLLTIDAAVLTIVLVAPIYGGETICMYELQAGA